MALRAAVWVRDQGRCTEAPSKRMSHRPALPRKPMPALLGLQVRPGYELALAAWPRLPVKRWRPAPTSLALGWFGPALRARRAMRLLWAYVSPDGHCCGSRRFLELHHTEPYGLGGDHSPELLTLRCRTHNLYDARAVYGDACIDAHIGRSAEAGRGPREHAR